MENLRIVMMEKKYLFSAGFSFSMHKKEIFYFLSAKKGF
jgi:hypothetical protein